MVGHEGRVQGSPLERKVLRDTVYDQLFRMLVDGSLRPGTSLSIDGLARDLCVSPTPVREALVHLEHTGLVRRAALRGYTAADPLTAKELRDLVAARRLLEGAALRAAVDRPDPQSGEGMPIAQQLADALAEQRRAYGEVTRHGSLCPPAPLYAYLVSEWEFHRVLVVQGGNPYLARMLDLLAGEMYRMRRRPDGRPFDATESIAEHSAIVRAVASGRPGSAEEALATHLDGLLARSLARLPRENS